MIENKEKLLKRMKDFMKEINDDTNQNESANFKY